MRAPISVCMTTYNGAEYISEQLDSILMQLGHKDEVIIVDDFSVDETVKIIEGYADARIKLHKNKKNQGVVKSFEKSIGHASHDFIFLSDQDDIWLPKKVDRCLSVMSSGVDLIVSDAYIMTDDEIMLDTFYAIRGSTPGLVRNYIKNSFIGCCMSFRRDLLTHALPFPEGIPMHDAWLGMMASINGEVKFLPDRLILYRRHDRNVTSMRRSSLLKIIASRIRFILAILFKIRNKK